MYDVGPPNATAFPPSAILHSTYVGRSFPRGQKNPKQQRPIIDPSKGFDTHGCSNTTAAGTIVDDPPLVDHPLVVSAANVSEEAAVDRNKCEFLVVQVGLPSYVSLSVRFSWGMVYCLGRYPPKP